MTAAVFSVERTLLDGSADDIIGRHLVQAGIAGPNWRSEQPEGWPVAEVGRVAEAVADELAEQVHPYARILLEEHRRAGDRLVLASRVPRPLIAPLAARLGVGDVVSPVWETRRGGTYTGRLDDAHPWGRGKLVGLRAWARGSAVSLRSASVYAGTAGDANLLAVAARPVAANPDPVLAALARLEGWPIRHLDWPSDVVKVAGRELQDWFRPLSRLVIVPNARIELQEVQRIPRHGPVILVFNHRSYFDPTAIALLIARAGRTARFLGKRQVFDAPVIGRLGRALGGIPVDRASGSDAPLDAAAAALAAGQLVCMAPQGTIPRGPAFFDVELKGRWGAARLAARTGAPVIPVGLWGTERVWPRSSRLPLWSWPPPKVTVRVGAPVELDRVDADDDTRAIMAAITALLPPEARRPRVPTPEELRRTFPPGYRGDATRESERRPGTDT